MTSFLATVVWHHALNKLEALDAVAEALQVPVTDFGTESARIVLSAGVWIHIEIPKFGEPPPVAIDVWSSQSREQALEWAHVVIQRLGESSEIAPLLDEDAR